MTTRAHFTSKELWACVLLALLGLGFLAVGVSFSGARLVSDLITYRAAQRWDEVPAKIVRAEWKDEDMGEGITCWVEAEYEYHYNGKRYIGKRVSLHGGSDNIGAFWSDVYRQLNDCRRTGRPFRCYVNPAQPAQALLYRDLRWEMVVFQSFITIVFAGGGLGLLIAIPFALSAVRREEVNAAAHPEEPWLWRKDWAGGEIKWPTRSQVMGPIAAALAWNLFAVPMGLLLLNDLINNRAWNALLAMIFPAIGLALLGWSIVVAIRWRKFGQSVFKMASVPGVIGGELAGVVCTSAKIRPESGFRLTLTCLQTDSSGDSTTTKIVWRHDQVVVRELLQHDAEQSAIPVSFSIPFECDPTDKKAGTKWELEVKAVVSGVKYCATFDVPVFKTSQSNLNFAPDGAALAKYVAPFDPERDLYDAGVLRMASPTGEGCRFVYSRRRFGIVVFASVCWLICSAAIVLLIYVQASPDGPIVLGLVDVLILLFLLKVGFYRSVVDVSCSGLAVTAGPFGLGRRHWVEACGIAELQAVRTMGDYSDIILLRCDNSRLILAKLLPSHRLATAVIRQIEHVRSEKASGLSPGR